MSEHATTDSVKPTARERIVARELVAGSTQKDALLAAGFSPASRGLDGVAKSEGVKVAVREAMAAAGLTPDHLAQVLMKSTEATKTTRITWDGATKETHHDPDYTERRRSVELALKALDAMPDESSKQPVAIQVNVSFVDGSDGW